MTARTLTLSDFLLARIADDEDWARRNDAGRPEEWPAQMSARCESQRRIMDGWAEAQQFYAENVAAPAGELAGLEVALRALALFYVDHPDYNPDWRP